MNSSYFLREADGARAPLRLDKVIHKGGGAGRICAVSGDGHSVAKLYHDPGAAAGYEAKIAAMLERPPLLPPIDHDGARIVQIAWPEAMIEDAQGRFAGFTMPFVDLGRAAPLDALLVKALRKRHGLPENYAYRLFAAQNLAAAVAELHRLGHHIIDLKPQNLSVYKQSMYVAVLDCDGLSIGAGNGARYPAHQFTDGYIAPEAALKGLAPEQLGEEQDRFALAVVLFQLLNQGVHPFQGVPRGAGASLGTQQERINAGLYPYGPRGNARQAPSPGSIHAEFEDETLELFRRAFDSSYRPSALEWREHLRALANEDVLQRCAANPAEHAHFSKGCGLCRLESGKQARLTAARKRARTTPRRTGARAGLSFPGFPVPRSNPGPRRRTARRPPPAPITWSGVARGALSLVAGLAGWIKTKLFGRPAGAHFTLPAGSAAMRAASYLLYGIFALNLLVLGLVFSSLMSPRDYYWLAKLVMSSGQFPALADLRVREVLQVLQFSSVSLVLLVTVLTAVFSHVLSRSATGTVCGTHGRWLAGTVWLAPVVGMLCLLVSLTWWSGSGVPLTVFPLWLIYRFGKGFLLLVQNRPLAAPGAVL